MARKHEVFTVRADGLNGKKALEYESTIIGMLRALDQFGIGHALMDAFRTYKKEVLVVPYDGSAGVCNALGGSAWGLYGTKVLFTPRGWFATSRCFKPTHAGNLADEVLVHELVHALRSAAKTLGKVSDAQEEEIAILVTNIYASFMNRPLRRNHASTARLRDPVLSTSGGFLNANRALIEAFCKQHPNVSRWMARVNAPFNPLQGYWAQVPVSAGGWRP